MSRYDPNSAGSNEEYEFFRYMQQKEETGNHSSHGRGGCLPGVLIFLVVIGFLVRLIF